MLDVQFVLEFSVSEGVGAGGGGPGGGEVTPDILARLKLVQVFLTGKKRNSFGFCVH